MSIHGKIVQLGSNSYGFELTDYDYFRPIQNRQIWKLETFRCQGMSWCQETDAIGKNATMSVGGNGYSTVSCYLGNGNYFTGSLPSNEKAIVCERKPAASPRVNKNTQTRWNSGRWEKYSMRKGWVAA